MKTPVMTTASAVMGSNVRRLRGEYTADELARECAVWGLKGGTAKIADVEAGRDVTDDPHCYLLTLSLRDLLGREVAPADCSTAPAT